MADGADESGMRAAAWFARMRGPDAAEHRGAFEAWYGADRRNAEAYRRIEGNWRRSDVLRNSHLAASFRLRSPWWRRFDLDRPFAYTPALAALILIVVTGVWVGIDRRPVPDPVIAQASRIGEVRAVTLDDGSRITLDTDSAITELFTAAERTVRLDRGRARFDVVHDQVHPFVVMAGSARITDVGTVFDVRLQQHQVKIVLLRGSVRVRSLAPASASTPTASKTLTAGQQAIVPTDEAPVISSGSAQAQTAWVNGVLDFDDTPLADVVAEVNRYSSHRIVLGEDRLATLRVTGTFRANGAADIAHSLAVMFELHVQADAHGNWILTPEIAGFAARTPGSGSADTAAVG